jgi:hypothetical protein
VSMVPLSIVLGPGASAPPAGPRFARSIVLAERVIEGHSSEYPERTGGGEKHPTGQSSREESVARAIVIFLGALRAGHPPSLLIQSMYRTIDNYIRAVCTHCGQCQCKPKCGLLYTRLLRFPLHSVEDAAPEDVMSQSVVPHSFCPVSSQLTFGPRNPDATHDPVVVDNRIDMPKHLCTVPPMLL